MIDGKQLRDAIISGANNIAENRESVDEMNVFPVPDGDTGTNMSMTTNAAKLTLEQLPDNCSAFKAAKDAASAMLRGARGNSGVITSLLFRGFSKAIEDKSTIETADVVEMFKQGVESAYKAVMNPTEGTILTVARVTAEQLEQTPFTDTVEQWDFVVKTANETLAKTPEQLPVLKKAGVVDAGGKGFCCILEGMQSVFKNGVIMQTSEEPVKKERLSTTNVGKGVFNEELNPDITNAYCTEFLINKNGPINAEKLRAFLESKGDSVVMVEDDDIVKCHIHAEDPGAVMSEALKYGYLTKLKIENMHEQYTARQSQAKGLKKQSEAEKQPKESQKFVYAAVDNAVTYGFVAVVAGTGLHNIFSDLGVDVLVSGGQTMNPSTDDILNAIQSVPAKTIFVLPNNKNIIMAAEQASKLADRKVVVLPTRTVPQGMNAMLAFDSEYSLDKNIVEMMKSAESVSTGLVTFAARDAEFDGKKIKQGEILGIADGKLVAVGNDITKVTMRLVRNMSNKHTDFITLISGCDVDEEEAESTLELVASKVSATTEVSLLNGGQPVYYYMVSVE